MLRISRITSAVALIAALSFSLGNASASLLTFDLTGNTDQILLGGGLNTFAVTALLTVDASEVGTYLGPYSGSSDAEHYDVTAPGTGLSITLDGTTLFSHTLGIDIYAHELNSFCGQPAAPLPFCDDLSIRSDLGYITLVSPAPAYGNGLTAATFDALGESLLQDWRPQELDPGLIINFFPNYSDEHGPIYGNIDSIVKAGEPSTLWMMAVALLALVMIEGGRAQRRNHVQVNLRPGSLHKFGCASNQPVS